MPTFPQHFRPWLAGGGGGPGDSSSSGTDTDSDDDPVTSSKQKRIQEQNKRIADLESQLEEAKATCAAAAAKPKAKAKAKTPSPRKVRPEKQEWGLWISAVRAALAKNDKTATTVAAQAELLKEALTDKLEPAYYNKDDDGQPTPTGEWETRGKYLGAVKELARQQNLTLDFKGKDQEAVNRCKAQWKEYLRKLSPQTASGGGGKDMRLHRKRKRAAGGGGGGAAAVTEVSSVASSSLPRASRRVQVGDLALR